MIWGFDFVLNWFSHAGLAESVKYQCDGMSHDLKIFSFKNCKWKLDFSQKSRSSVRAQDSVRRSSTVDWSRPLITRCVIFTLKS